MLFLKVLGWFGWGDGAATTPDLSSLQPEFLIEAIAPGEASYSTPLSTYTVAATVPLTMRVSREVPQVIKLATSLAKRTR